MHRVAPWIILSMFPSYIRSATVVVVHDEESLATGEGKMGTKLVH